MPDEAENKAQDSQKKKKLPMKALVILLGIMLLEGGIFVACMYAMDPEPSSAEGTDDESAEPAITTKELPVIQSRGVPNKQGGRVILYDIEVQVICDVEDAKELAERFKTNEADIRDRFRAVVAKADPNWFDNDPDLVTLKKQIKIMLEEVVGEGMIQRVLVPSCLAHPQGL